MALALALVPATLSAQSVNDWQLPGATVRPAPGTAQGPVDRDNPVITTTVRPTPSATPVSQPAATPSPVATSPAPAASATRPAPTAPRTTAPQRTPPAPTTAAPTATPSLATPDASAVPQAVATPESSPAASGFALPPPAAAAAPASAGWYWPWIAGAAGLVAAIFAFLWWRRRRDPLTAAPPFERPVVAPPKAETDPAPVAAKPEPARVPPPTPLPEPQLAAAVASALGITLEARRMNASLMATSLSYVLKLTNTGSEPLSAVAVEGDMVSAHSSLPPEAQIANDNQRLELRHALVALAPGESAEFTGDFRLPLTSVTPIRAGDAAYFVPLARLRVEASTPKGDSLVQVQTFVVGELPDDPGAALRPFRLDLGPRTYSRLGQRAVS